MLRGQKEEFDVGTHRDVTAANNCQTCPTLRRVFCLFSCSQEVDKMLSDSDLRIERKLFLPTVALPIGRDMVTALALLLALLVVGCLVSP